MYCQADTIIGDILDGRPEAAAVFERFDMPCTDCPSSRGETLAEACALHDVELDLLVRELNALPECC